MQIYANQLNVHNLMPFICNWGFVFLINMALHVIIFDQFFLNYQRHALYISQAFWSALHGLTLSLINCLYAVSMLTSLKPSNHSNFVNLYPFSTKFSFVYQPHVLLTVGVSSNTVSPNSSYFFQNPRMLWLSLMPIPNFCKYLITLPMGAA